ncbi:lipopolysaccharide biosynthesis protein [Ancylobacter sp. MQZ15Z-1]|uniref:Lipopolysaccharide biosynthesis protein n=1 Tax=Ancylobacter mangrovi TaxID=2972472 RepID=A0A9X2PIY6_9HYPH|nr:lipopolysaccharide biosynthesis protein [Ancylobacter mangrovi]
MLDERTIAQDIASPEGAHDARRTPRDGSATGNAVRGGLRSGFARRHLLVPALAGLLVAGVASQLVAPRYTSEARISAEGRSSGTSGSQAQIIGSREFARQLLDDKDLAARLAPDAAGKRLAGAIGLGEAGASQESRALEAIESGLDVRALADGQTAIRFTSADPRLSADIANAFAAAYLRLRREKAAFNMDPNGPISTAARLAASAVPASEPATPAPFTVALGLGFAGFGASLGLRRLLRRRERTVPPPEPTHLPQTAPQGETQHLPWIGGEMAGDYPDDDFLVPRRRLSRDGELADLSRLIELRGEAARLVVVTGPTPDEGIARCALALGRSLASAERRVVIVCLDVAAAPLDSLTEDPRAPGLTDLLFGVASFSDAIHRENASRCHVIPPGRGAREADGLIGADRLALILGALVQTYDHVVVAAPPLGGCEGAQGIAALKPTLILVTQPGGPATEAVRAFDGLADLGFAEIAMVTFAEVAENPALCEAA